jgi:quercetin dioxygenase-like cupin family protein
MMTYYNPFERAYKELSPGVRARTFWGENLLISLVELDANALIPTHSHPHEQSTYIIEGELEADIAGERRRVHTGELLIIPGGTEHSVRVGPALTKVLDAFSPVREDLKY